MNDMKLIKRTVELNEEDSTPEFEVTLRVPVDPLSDDIARNEMSMPNGVRNLLT